MTEHDHGTRGRDFGGVRATAVLERLQIPDHDPAFWAELRFHMVEPTEAGPLGQPARGTLSRSVRRWPTDGGRRILLVAAVLVILAAGAATLVARTDADRTQSIDTGPSPTSVPEPGPSTPDESQPSPVPASDEGATRSVARGSDGEWFHSDDITWTGEQFTVAAGTGNDPRHLSSTDGLDWSEHDGDSPLLPQPARCPDGFTCNARTDVPRIPFFHATVEHDVLARAGDVLLMNAWVRYGIDQQDRFGSEDRELVPGPVLPSDLLAAAASTDSCFEAVRNQPGQPVGDDQAHISGWSSGGTENPVISLTCSEEGHTAGFQLDLRDHLTTDQIRSVYSFGDHDQFWVEEAGAPARRLDDPPTTSFWIDGADGGEIVSNVVVASTGDRFWALDEGTLTQSFNGVNWTTQPVPTGELEPQHVIGVPGGHLALRLGEDRRWWDAPVWVTVSHDNGRTWSPPVEVEPGTLTVGPAGAVVVGDREDMDDSITVTLVDGGATTFSRELPVGVCCVTAVVGEDRVLVQSPEVFDVYGFDGSLLHQATWSSESRWWSYDRPWSVILLVLLTAALAWLTKPLRRPRQRLR